MSSVTVCSITITMIIENILLTVYTTGGSGRFLNQHWHQASLRVQPLPTNHLICWLATRSSCFPYIFPHFSVFCFCGLFMFVYHEQVIVIRWRIHWGKWMILKEGARGPWKQSIENYWDGLQWAHRKWERIPEPRPSAHRKEFYFIKCRAIHTQTPPPEHERESAQILSILLSSDIMTDPNQHCVQYYPWTLRDHYSLFSVLYVVLCVCCCTES